MGAGVDRRVRRERQWERVGEREGGGEGGVEGVAYGVLDLRWSLNDFDGRVGDCIDRRRAFGLEGGREQYPKGAECMMTMYMIRRM